MRNKSIHSIIAAVIVTLIFGGFTVFAYDGEKDDVVLSEESLIPDTFYKAKVIEVLKEETKDYQGIMFTYQAVKVRVEDGDMKGKELEITHESDAALSEYQRVKEGDAVVIVKTEIQNETNYYIVDKHRLPWLGLVLIIFFGLVIFFSRWKGLASIMGLIVSIAVLGVFIVPRIMSGHDPLFTGLTGAFIIAVLSIYTAHGLNKRTSIALLGTLITLASASLLAILFVSLAKLSGIGTEEVFYLQFGNFESVNLRGLLLAGIIIGALGVLDDVTTSQTATIDEIKKADPTLSLGELYKRGFSVGREHIASLVNTLVLAYAGASLPLFLLFSINKAQPLWVILNSEFIAEEVIRTLVGSTALVLAVPISTFLAAYFFSRNKASI